MHEKKKPTPAARPLQRIAANLGLRSAITGRRAVGRSCDCPLMRDSDRRIVRAYWLARGRFWRSDPQIDASDANFPSSRVVRVVLSWRRSLQRPTFACPLRFVGATAGRLGYRPADDRPSLFARTDRQGASLEVSQFPSAFADCAVLFESDQPSNHPATAFCRLGVTQRPSAGSPLRFLAPRVSGALGFAILETPPARVIRGRLLFGARTGPADRAVIAAWPGVLVPATLLGFSSALRSIALVRG